MCLCDREMWKKDKNIAHEYYTQNETCQNACENSGLAMNIATLLLFLKNEIYIYIQKPQKIIGLWNLQNFFFHNL